MVEKEGRKNKTLKMISIDVEQGEWLLEHKNFKLSGFVREKLYILMKRKENKKTSYPAVWIEKMSKGDVLEEEEIPDMVAAVEKVLRDYAKQIKERGGNKK